MLILSRKIGEKIVIQHPGGNVVVTVEGIDRGKVKLSFSAPRSVDIKRLESKLEQDRKWG